jgi:hypothetical protein
MALSNTTLHAPLGTDVYSDTAVTNSLVQMDAGGTTVYHMEFDNTANTAVTYYKVWNVVSGSVTLGTTQPSFIFPCEAGAKQYMTMPTAVSFATAFTYIATSTQSNNTSQSAPANAVGLTVSYSS